MDFDFDPTQEQRRIPIRRSLEMDRDQIVPDTSSALSILDDPRLDKYAEEAKQKFTNQRSLAANQSSADSMTLSNLPPLQVPPEITNQQKPAVSSGASLLDDPRIDKYAEEAKQKIAQESFKDRGFFGRAYSATAGGVVRGVESGLRGARTMLGGTSAPGAVEPKPGDILTPAVQGVSDFVAEHPSLQETPDAGWIEKGVGSAVQSISTKAIPTAVGAVIGGGIPGAVAGYLLGGAALYGLAQYDDVIERADKAGISREVSEPEAIIQGVAEWGFEEMSDIVDMLTLKAGGVIGKGLISKPGKEALKEGIRGLLARNWKQRAMTMAGIALGEIPTEMATSGFEAESDKRLGLGNTDFWDAAKDAFGPTLVASLIFGGLAEGGASIRRRTIINALENPNTSDKTRFAAARAVYGQIYDTSPELADSWAKNATEAIHAGESISTNQDIMELQEKVRNLSNVPNLSEVQRANLDKYRKQLAERFAKIEETELPKTEEGLLEEQTYLDQLQRVSPESEAWMPIERRKREVQEGLRSFEEMGEQYQQHKERVGPAILPEIAAQPVEELQRKIVNLNRIKKRSPKQEENLKLYEAAIGQRFDKQRRQAPAAYEEEIARQHAALMPGLAKEEPYDRTSESRIPGEVGRRQEEPGGAVQDQGAGRREAAPGGVLEEAQGRGKEGIAAPTIVDLQAHQAATSPLNEIPEPTEAQKEAGNYKKGHIEIQGMDVSIENPVGSTRSGVSLEGKKWKTTMQNHYGYIKGTVGKDKDHIDAFIGPNPQSETVFVVNQQDPATGKFDEHKAMLGFDNEPAAREAYLANYQPGWKGLKSIVPMPIEQFKKWSKDKKSTKKEAPTPVQVEPLAATGDEDLDKAMQEALASVQAIEQQQDQQPEATTTQEVAAEKAHVKGVLQREIAAGTIPVGAAVRATDMTELEHILKTGSLREGMSFEGRTGISATQITTKDNPPVPMYGSYEHVPVAIVAPEGAIHGKGESVNEVLLNPKTDVNELRFSIDKHDRLYTIQELPGVLESIEKGRIGAEPKKPPEPAKPVAKAEEKTGGIPVKAEEKPETGPKSIGINEEGYELFEDADGNRYYSDGKFRRSAPRPIMSTGGVLKPWDVDTLYKQGRTEYLTKEEVEARKPAPKEVPVEEEPAAEAPTKPTPTGAESDKDFLASIQDRLPQMMVKTKININGKIHEGELPANEVLEAYDDEKLLYQQLLDCVGGG